MEENFSGKSKPKQANHKRKAFTVLIVINSRSTTRGNPSQHQRHPTAIVCNLDGGKSGGLGDINGAHRWRVGRGGGGGGLVALFKISDCMDIYVIYVFTYEQ
jgi:hypothetical protein